MAVETCAGGGQLHPQIGSALLWAVFFFLHAKKQALQSTVLTPSLLSVSIVLLGGYAQTTTFTAPFSHSMRHCFGT